MTVADLQAGDYTISCDPGRLDVASIHAYLATSYWSPGIPREVVERGIAHSLPFAVYRGEEQVGFARVITDRATFAYLADVYILEPHRGQGLSKRMIEYVLAHPDLQGLRRLMLATRDAHGLYRRFGFTPLKDASRIMERLKASQYRAA